MIKLNNYSVMCQENYILDNINLHIPKQAFFCIIGESGGGKTILTKAILDILPLNLHPNGELLVNNSKIEIILQDPINSLQPNIKIGTQFNHLLKSNGIKNKKERHQQMNSALESVGFSDSQAILTLKPYELSGGMCQKVAIAIALLQRADVLIADEPTSALDFESQNSILNLLKKLYFEKKLTILFITHDLNIARDYATHIGIINQGKLVESGQTEKVLKSPTNPYTKELIEIFETNY